MQKPRKHILAEIVVVDICPRSR